MSRIFTCLVMACALCSAAYGATPGLSPADSVQIGFPGQFTGNFLFLNTIPASGLDVDDDGAPDIGKPCSCRPLPPVTGDTFNNDGIFDSWLVIATGVSGQQWHLEYAAEALHPVTLVPLPIGLVVPEVGSSGVYVLHFAHRDAAQYQFLLENPTAFPTLSFGPVLNTCYYPNPQIGYLDDFYCSNSPGTLLYGFATSAFDGNIFPIPVQDEYWVITRQQNNQSYYTPSFNPETLGQGNYKISYSFNAGDNAFAAPNKTGCTVTVESETVVRDAYALSCNSSINITLNPNICEAEVVPSMLLTFTPITYRGYKLEVLDPFGNTLGTRIPSAYAYVPLLGVLTDSCTGNYCTTEIIARDVHAPVLTIPADITLPCTSATGTAITGEATATDCSPHQITYHDEMATFGCGNPIARITRTWRATDIFGNTTSRIQTIHITRGTQTLLRFPADVEYDCTQYAADPSITDPAPGKAGIPNLVDVPLCSFVYTSSDDTIRFCGNPNASFVILRTWTVLDACGFQIFTIDGAGNDNIQFIRVKDETPPVISPAPALMTTTLPPQQNGLQGCSAVGFIPPPAVADACNNFVIRIITPLGEAEYVNGQDGAQGGFVPFPGLRLGAHSIVYEATDACGNRSTVEGIVEVVDSLPPVMLCNSSLTMVLTSAGQSRLQVQQIDAGSRDDCCIGNKLLKLAGEPDNAFRPFIDFFCPTNPLETVILRATDCFGNMNECSAQVHIVDPVSLSVVSAPGNVTVTCLDDLSPYSNPTHNAPVFSDNCPFDTQFSFQSNINNCGIGTLHRTWIAGGTATATQTVFVNGVFNYRFTLPNDLLANCGAGTAPDNIQILSQTCDQLVITLTVDTVTNGPGNCISIQRTFDIHNLCEALPGTAPAALPRLSGLQTGKGYEVLVQNGTIYQVAFDGSLNALGPANGRYRYVQRWDILDGEPPQFTFTPPPVFCTQGACNGPVELDFAITDNCAAAVSILRRLRLNNQTITPDTYGTMTPTGQGQYRIAGNYPQGTHSLEFILDDGCGNFVSHFLPFEVRDCQLPTLFCIQELLLTLDSMGTLQLQPQQFALLAQDNCPGASLSFNPSVMDPIRTMNCDSVGLRTINVWLTDASGNQAACQSNVEVISPPGVCPAFWPIRGIVRTENQAPVAHVTIHLEGGLHAQEVTPSNGRYEFPEIPGNAAYTVRPEKLIHSANGVSTFDLVLISRHILGVEPFSSPYKIIAADVNRSGSVSTLDLILLRRMILGVDAVFSNNTSWRFIPAGYEFQVPSNPFFGIGFPELAIIPNLRMDTIINFIGIKVGDVNGSADPQQ